MIHVYRWVVNKMFSTTICAYFIPHRSILNVQFALVLHNKTCIIIYFNFFILIISNF